VLPETSRTGYGRSRVDSSCSNRAQKVRRPSLGRAGACHRATSRARRPHPRSCITDALRVGRKPARRCMRARAHPQIEAVVELHAARLAWRRGQVTARATGRGPLPAPAEQQRCRRRNRSRPGGGGAGSGSGEHYWGRYPWRPGGRRCGGGGKRRAALLGARRSPVNGEGVQPRAPCALTASRLRQSG